MRDVPRLRLWLQRAIFKIALVILVAAPLYAQRGEVYGVAGYSRTPTPEGWFANSTLLPIGNGGSYGGGIGARLVSIVGVEAEFGQDRGSGGFGTDSSHVYTGFSLNLVLEKRSGRIRPDLLAGVGGGSLALHFPMKNMYSVDLPGEGVSHYSAWSAQFGGGAAVQLHGRLFLRPQIRYQYRQEFQLLGGGAKLPSPVFLCVALGYRF